MLNFIIRNLSFLVRFLKLYDKLRWILRNASIRLKFATLSNMWYLLFASIFASRFTRTSLFLLRLVFNLGIQGSHFASTTKLQAGLCFAWICFMIIGSADVYGFLIPYALENSTKMDFLFSFQVTVFQRPYPQCLQLDLSKLWLWWKRILICSKTCEKNA